MLFVPASSDRFLESALKRPTDAIQLDLEDSVAHDLKDSARAHRRARGSRSECRLRRDCADQSSLAHDGA
jgi:citrate lyase subunit beta/citryl-CoA lyase